VRGSAPAVSVPASAGLLARVTALITVVVLVLGTVVTGAGPHAGDKDASGKVHRNGLKVSSMAQLHADSVWILVGATVGLVAVFYAVHAADRVRRAAWLLLAVELGQGVIGYVQYFLHVPPLLVGLHMLGACLLWLAMLYVLAQLEPRAATRPTKTQNGCPAGSA
jgi:cytochrome c oxidase assembly protein subunit 15